MRSPSSIRECDARSPGSSRHARPSVPPMRLPSARTVRSPSSTDRSPPVTPPDRPRHSSRPHATSRQHGPRAPTPIAKRSPPAPAGGVQRRDEFRHQGVAGEVPHRLPHLPQRLRRTRRRHLRERATHRTTEEVDEHRIHRAEVVVDEPVVHTGTSRDTTSRHRGIPLLQHERLRRVQQRTAHRRVIARAATRTRHQCSPSSRIRRPVTRTTTASAPRARRTWSITAFWRRPLGKSRANSECERVIADRPRRRLASPPYCAQLRPLEAAVVVCHSSSKVRRLRRQQSARRIFPAAGACSEADFDAA